MTARSQARSKFPDGTSTSQDSILVTLSETSVFRITRSSDAIDLARVSFQNNVSVEGGGTQIWGDDLPTVTWTYGPGPKLQSPRGRVTLKKDGVHGIVNVQDFAANVTAEVKAQEPWDTTAVEVTSEARRGGRRAPEPSTGRRFPDLGSIEYWRRSLPRHSRWSVAPTATLRAPARTWATAGAARATATATAGPLRAPASEASPGTARRGVSRRRLESPRRSRGRKRARRGRIVPRRSRVGPRRSRIVPRRGRRAGR